MSSVKERFHTDGLVLLRAGEHPYSADDMDRLVDLCLRLPRPDGVYDDSKVSVGRIVVDSVDVVRAEHGFEPPTVEAPELAERILMVAASGKAMDFWGEVSGGGPVRLCRAQTNYLQEGGNVGSHNDHESNPDYRVSVVVGLSDDYTGGDFMAEVAPGDTRRFRVGRGDVLVAKPELQHAVDLVESGTRASLVLFMS